MKKNLFFAAAIAAVAAAGMTSCSNDEGVENIANAAAVEAPSKVQFSILQNNQLATRGVPTTAANWQTQIADFMVWGYFTPMATGSGVTSGSLYMGTSATVGTVFNGTGGSYNYANSTKMVYWPAVTAPLNFQAVTPASDASFSIENVPNAGLARVTAVVNVPTATADQKDIMFAKVDNQTKESNADYKAPLNFKHGLSQVVFAGRTASDNIVAELTSVELHNIYGTGRVGFFGTSSALASETTGVAGTTFSPILLSGAGDLTVSSTTAKNLTAEDGALLMLPQNVTKWATLPGTPVTPGAADLAHNSYMKVHVASVTSNGVTLMSDQDIYIPVEIAWEQGKKYVYTIVFGQGTGGYDEDGKPLDNMLPIMFTVEQTEWVEADPQPTVSF